MADGDLRETDLARDARHQLFVIRIAIGMHEDDGDSLIAVAARLFQSRAHGPGIGCRLDRPVGENALVDLDHAIIELVGLPDRLGENVGPALITNAQGVAKTLCRDEQGAIALAFEQGVRRHGGAHAHLADSAFRDRLRHP